MSDKTKALAVTPAVGWTPDPKAPWRCLICGSERSACICLPREKVTPVVGGEAPIPTYGNLPWDQLGRDVMEANMGTRCDFEFDPKFYPGHQSVSLNFNSLARIVDKYRLAAPPASLLRGRETVAEIQSGMDRQKWAENLILQLPIEHDGRNSWLLNYGRGEFAQALRKDRELLFNEQSQAINPPASPPEQPLRGRESVREIAHRHCTCTCRGDPAVLQNHTNLCDSIADAILEYAAIPNKDPNE